MPHPVSIRHRLIAGASGLAGCAGLWLAGIAPAHALPSFARQTGEECAACHVGAFGPQLTPHGMKFKLEGYTESNSKSPMLPLSGMVVASYGHTKADPEEGSNNRKSLQEISAFYAGKVTDHLGAFVQATTASDAHGTFSLDNVDLRYTQTMKLSDGDVLVGLTLNNNPTVTDVFNTVPAWRFPYMSAEMVEPAGSPLLDGGLEMQVAGLSAYALWNDSIYAELGGYKSLSKRFLDQVNVDAGDKIGGVAPYWRLAYMKDNHKDAWSVGLLGMEAKLHDGYDDGPTDKYHDVGIDATYQYLGNRKNVFTANAAYIHERRDLDRTDPGAKINLNRLDVSGSYHYDQTYGATLGLFNIQGDSNDAAFGGSPDTRGYTLQADWTPFGKESSWGAPWANLRLGLQYTAYDRFNGERQGASDHNTLYAFLWTAF